MAGFVCIYYGNTGSSWLVAALGSSPRVLVPGFEPLESWAWKAPAEERLDWLRTALRPPAERSGPDFDGWKEKLRASPQVGDELDKTTFEIVGFKMNDLAMSFTGEVARAVADSGARVIFLTRRNRIKHALSLYRYHEEEKSQFGGDGINRPTKLHLRKFAKWVDESQRLHSEATRIRSELSKWADEDLISDVAYEEFLDDDGKMETLERLCSFLGIPTVDPAQGRFGKATPDSLRSAVINYNRLWLRYRSSEFAEHFDD